MAKKLFKTRSISKKEALKVGERLGINWKVIDVEQFRIGLEVEQEHSDMVGDNVYDWGRIAIAHILEVPDYYTKLRKHVDPN